MGSFHTYRHGLEALMALHEPRSVFMMVGSPGSGKSYLSEQIAHELDIPRISSDTIRQQLTGDEANQGIESVIWETVHAYVSHHLSRGESVLIDATHSDYEVRIETICRYKHMAPAKIIAIYITTPLSAAIVRNRNRARVIPDSEVKRMFNAVSSHPPSNADGFDEVIVIKN